MKAIEYISLFQREVSKARIICQLEYENSGGLILLIAYLKLIKAIRAEAQCILLHEGLTRLQTLIETIVHLDDKTEVKSLVDMSKSFLNDRPITLKKSLLDYILSLSQWMNPVSSAAYIMPTSMKRIYGFDLLHTSGLERVELLNGADTFIRNINSSHFLDHKNQLQPAFCLSII